MDTASSLSRKPDEMLGKGVTCDRLTSHPGVASCYRNWDKLHWCGPDDPCTDFKFEGEYLLPWPCLPSVVGRDLYSL